MNKSQYTGKDTATEKYDITKAEAQDAEWSGKHPLPNIGDKVNCIMNSIGESIVVAYFTSDGGDKWYAGIEVKVLRPPEWYIRQNGKDSQALVFGSEIEPFVSDIDRVKEIQKKDMLEWKGKLNVYAYEVLREWVKEMNKEGIHCSADIVRGQELTTFVLNIPTYEVK